MVGSRPVQQGCCNRGRSIGDDTIMSSTAAEENPALGPLWKQDSLPSLGVPPYSFPPMDLNHNFTCINITSH